MSMGKYICYVYIKENGDGVGWLFCGDLWVSEVKFFNRER